MSRFIIKALSKSAANIRIRIISRHSKIMSRNFEDTKLNESDNKIIRLTNENQNHQNRQNRQNRREKTSLNLRYHSSYRKDNSKNSMIMRMNNLIEFRKTINHEIDESRWMTYMIKALEYNESMFNKHFELNNAWKKERLRRKEMKKILFVIQEKLAHKKNKIVEMISSNLTREFIQISREFIQISAKATRIKINYRLWNIHSTESLKEEEKKKYESWVYAIGEKLQTDSLMYDNDRERVRYDLSQIKNSIFDVMHDWIIEIENDVTLKTFFVKIENYMRLHRCYAPVPSTSTSYLVICTFTFDQASLLDKLSKASVNRARSTQRSSLNEKKSKHENSYETFYK
jgi:hypothetical protein